MRITASDNERLTRVGPGTPMGEVFRRYWLPALLSSEVPRPDAPPVRVRLLGEDLVAFRDSVGEVGLLDAYCAHRRAPLFFGRNEECGLRCVYHGWKYDTTGACVDMPSEPPYSRFRLRVSVKSYPTYEGAGIIWAYLGPNVEMPPPPDYEWLRVPADKCRVSKVGESCNYLQALEGGIDTAHSSFAHNNDITNPRRIRNLDTHPELEVERTDYGFRYASKRQLGDDRTYLRLYQFMMPNQQLRGHTLNNEGERLRLPLIKGHVWVPIDDTHTFVYNLSYCAEESDILTDEEWTRIEAQSGRGPEDYEAGSPWLIRKLENDYLIDRELQRTKTFTGIKGVNTQDFAIQEGMGPIVEREKEALGSTDLAIRAARELLLEAIEGVGHETPLLGTRSELCKAVRAIDVIIPSGVPWQDVAKEAAAARW